MTSSTSPACVALLLAATVSVQSTTRISQRPANTKPPHTSAHHNSTNMSPVEAAIADVHALEPGEKFLYTKIASQFGVSELH